VSASARGNRYNCVDPKAIDLLALSGLHSLQLASRLTLAELNALRLATAEQFYSGLWRMFRENTELFMFTVSHALKVRFGMSLNIILFIQAICFLIFIVFHRLDANIFNRPRSSSHIFHYWTLTCRFGGGIF